MPPYSRTVLADASLSGAGRARRVAESVAAVTIAAALVLGGAVAASAADGGAGRSPEVGTPSAPVPDPPTSVPEGIEDAAAYVRQASCDPTTKPGSAALVKLLTSTYPGTTAGVGRSCGADGMASEHYEGRAVDWMVSVRDPASAARAEAFIGWLLAPDAQGRGFAAARRLGVMYIIWNDRIWGAYSASSGWRPYSACAGRPEPVYDTSCHRDHVHLSLSWAGAMGRTSYWTGQVAGPDFGPCRPADLNWAPPYSTRNPAPCPSFGAVTARAGSSALAAAIARYSGATVGPGSTGPVVSAVQKALGVTADGDFGDLTGTAVATYRASRKLPAGRQVDAAMWRALLATVTSAPAAKPSTTPAAKPAPASTPKPAAGPPSTPPSAPLQYGSTGSAVTAVQRALKVTPRSGWFGPLTRTAVTAFQASRKLPATGVVDAVTWRALGL